MYGIRQNLYDEMIEVFKNANVYRVYLFGSRARGDFNATSDIDIAVEFLDNDKDNLIKLYTKLEELNTLYKFDIADMSMLDNSKFKKEIEKDRVEIYKK